MIKVEEKQYRIRETISTNGTKSYRPESSVDWENWEPTHSFSFTWQPFYATSYKEALKCIKQYKEWKSEVIHLNPLEKGEDGTQTTVWVEPEKEDCCGSIVLLIVWNVLLSLGVILSLCISIK